MSNARHERVMVETANYRVEGDITLPQEGYRNELFDYLNRRNQEFLIIMNAEMTALDGSGRDWQAQSITLAKKHVRLIAPKGHDQE
ncbi:MAG TPA: hypothetical protein VMU29_05990 [Smithella sp.]|nr:hypothetical protein [Smithella sp.]